MKLNYCTLFDSNYLARGWAMYESLQVLCIDFHLYIFAFDDTCYQVINKLNLQNCTVISLKDFEDEKLLNIKPTRTRAEYCWTCTASTVWYVLNHFEVDHCTYIDADMFFYNNPLPLYTEMDDKSVLITEHWYSNDNGLTEKFGRFNVQYVTFKNNPAGKEVCEWWRNACIDWCYDRVEEGKYGDQKYLDTWPVKFPQVHILQHRGGGVATWNAANYSFSMNEQKLVGQEINTNKQFDVIFYHFHGVRFYQNQIVKLSVDAITKEQLDYFYKPYVRILLQYAAEINKIDASFDSNGGNTKSPANLLSARDKAYLYRKAIMAGFKSFSLTKLKAELHVVSDLISLQKNYYHYPTWLNL